MYTKIAHKPILLRTVHRKDTICLSFRLKARYSFWGFSERKQNSLFCQFWQVHKGLKQENVVFMKCCQFYVLGCKPSKKLDLFLTSPQNIFLMGIIKMLFGKCVRTVFGQQWCSPWNFSMDFYPPIRSVFITQHTKEAVTRATSKSFCNLLFLEPFWESSVPCFLHL